MTKEITQTQAKMKDLTRRQIRYLCFRLQTEADGGAPADPAEGGVMSLIEEVKDHMESQDDFGGWNMFAKTWDVDENSPLVVVKRTSSIYSEWNKVLKKESKDLPPAPVTTKIIETPPPAKNSKRDASGKFVSGKKGKTPPPPPEPKPEAPIVEEIEPALSEILPETPLESSPEPAKKKGFWNLIK